MLLDPHFSVSTLGFKLVLISYRWECTVKAAAVHTLGLGSFLFLSINQVFHKPPPTLGFLCLCTHTLTHAQMLGKPSHSRQRRFKQRTKLQNKGREKLNTRDTNANGDLQKVIQSGLPKPRRL